MNILKIRFLILLFALIFQVGWGLDLDFPGEFPARQPVPAPLLAVLFGIHFILYSLSQNP